MKGGDDHLGKLGRGKMGGSKVPFRWLETHERMSIWSGSNGVTCRSSEFPLGEKRCCSTGWVVDDVYQTWKSCCKKCYVC